MLILIISSILCLIAVDQILKFWAIENLIIDGSRQFLKFGDKEIINLTYLENDGAIFGSFSGMRLVLIISTIILLSFCIYYLFKNYKSNPKIFNICLVLLISGGLGNLIDRIFRGGNVIDYIEIRLFDFAIFNFADCCVTVGAILLIVYILFFESKLNTKLNGESNE